MTDLLLAPNRALPAGHHTSHKNIILIGVIISFFVIVLALTIANSRSSFFGRAASVPVTSGRVGGLSLENSYLFASPVSATADGSSIIRVTVIILSDTGLGVAGAKIELKSATTGLTITQTQPVTDAFGRAMFDVTSSNLGSYTISAETSGASLPQTVSVVFR